MNFIIFLLLFFIYSHHSFSSSFDRLTGVLQRYDISKDFSAELFEEVEKIHQDLVNKQHDLYIGIQKAVPENIEPSNTSVKSGKSNPSSKSAKSKNNDLLNTNFALATLCIVTKHNKILKIPVYNMDSQLMYDSCFEGMHNIVPGEGGDIERGLGASLNQWKRYLGNDAIILKEDTQTVKEKILLYLVQLKQTVHTMIKQCDEQNYEGALNSITQIENQRRDYFSYLRTWSTCGWHNEQRIIYDMDRSEIERCINDIHQNQGGVKLIIACVHTRLAPCIASEQYRSCDCYHCLQNWSKKWNLNGIYPSIMTTSYVSYPKSTDEGVYKDKQEAQHNNDTSHYFIKRYDVPSE